MSREEALQRMADRCGVDDLNSFVAVLIQSAQLGVSISLVLHSQAAEMRTKRRQRAEALARSSGRQDDDPAGVFHLPGALCSHSGPAIPQILKSLKGI